MRTKFLSRFINCKGDFNSSIDEGIIVDWSPSKKRALIEFNKNFTTKWYDPEDNHFVVIEILCLPSEIKTHTKEEMIAAQCLWEVIVSTKESDAPWSNFLSNHGSFEMRDFISSIAIICSQDWNTVKDDELDGVSFDGEFCPKWLRENIDWSSDSPALIK